MDLSKIIEFIKTAHVGQRRKGGQPYYMHPIAVMEILQSYGVVAQEILAGALLHDVLEDCPGYTTTDIARVANMKVAHIVEELTRIDPPEASWLDKAASLNKKAKTFSREASYIKLADRLHNVGTSLHDFEGERAAQYAKATLSLMDNMPKIDEYSLLSQMARDLKKLCNENLFKIESLANKRENPKNT